MKPNCCSNRLFRSVALGQTVSLFVAGTGICSQYLSRLHVNVPATQSVLNYVLLSSYIIFHCAVKRRRLNVSWPQTRHRTLQAPTLIPSGAGGVVEVFALGHSRCGSELPGGEGVSVHHHHVCYAF